jgi:tRNA-dihydrouridine synthase A
LGVDDADSYSQLAAFVQTVSEAGGVTDFVIHARKCLLNGISPAQNRSVPPLRHDWVWALKRDFPHLSFQVRAAAAAAAGQLLVDQGLGHTNFYSA